MITLAELEDAVAKLPLSDLVAFRDWFDAFEADRFDRRIAEDAVSGKLDRFADEARAEHGRGDVRAL